MVRSLRLTVQPSLGIIARREDTRGYDAASSSDHMSHGQLRYCVSPRLRAPVSPRHSVAGRALAGLIFMLTVGVATLSAPAAEPARSLNDLTGPWQLFVDDHLVANKEKVVRKYHAFEKDPGNPLLKADKPWEGNNVYVYGTVLPNESGPGYRMWYHALPEKKGDDAYRLLYATSKDGLRWDKPNLGIVEYQGSKDNNIFIRRGKRDHILSVIHTPWERDPAHRYLMINFDGDISGGGSGYMAAWSGDGIHWTNAADKPVFAKGGDVGQFLYDFHRGEYVGYVKNSATVSGMRRRAVGRTATKDPVKWPDPSLVIVPDSFDDRWAKGIQRTSFYGLSAFAYETMYLGFLWVFRAIDETEGYFDGPIFCELVSSRDGVNWLRQEGDRAPVLDVGSDKAWDRGMVFTATQPLVVGEQLWLYYGGTDGLHAGREPWHSGIGLATLRKDGFASLDATDGVGTVTTKCLLHAKGMLGVNCAATGGSVRVEVLTADGKVVPGYGRADCNAITNDTVNAVMSWKQRKELPSGMPIRLRFVLERASLYSFTAGENVRVRDEPDRPPLSVLLTFEDGWKDSLAADGEQNTKRHGDMRTVSEAENVAFGKAAVCVGSEFSPLQTLEIKGTQNLGTSFTLAMMARSKDNRHARLLSSYDDYGPVKSTELVFDCDPTGKRLNGLRLICKGIEIASKPVRFDDGKYHHLAVTYEEGKTVFYLDGVEVGGGSIPGGEPIAMERDLRVGEDSEHANEQQFRGHMDDVLVYGRALTAAEIKAITTRGAEVFFKVSKNRS